MPSYYSLNYDEIDCNGAKMHRMQIVIEDFFFGGSAATIAAAEITIKDEYGNTVRYKSGALNRLIVRGAEWIRKTDRTTTANVYQWEEVLNADGFYTKIKIRYSIAPGTPCVFLYVPAER